MEYTILSVLVKISNLSNVLQTMWQGPTPGKPRSRWVIGLAKAAETGNRDLYVNEQLQINGCVHKKKPWLQSSDLC